MRTGGQIRRLSPLLLIVFGVALAAIITFLALRVTDEAATTPCERAPGDWYGFARTLLKDYREPCAVFYWMPNPEDEFHNHVQLNNYGLVDSDYTLEKPPGVFRVIVVGDSFPQGLQVEREQGFPWLLEVQLRHESGREIEVINLSMDAWGTDRQLLLYALLGWRFQPDLVLLALYTGNDIQDNHIDLEARRYGYRLDRPFFTLGASGLQLHNSPIFDSTHYSDSPAYQWLTRLQAAQTPPPEARLPERPRVLETNPYTLEYPVELGLYLPEDAYWREAWGITEALLLEFRDVVTAQDIPFAAVIIPDRRAVEPDDWAATLGLYSGVLPELNEADPTHPGTWLENFLIEHNIPNLNLTLTLIARRGRGEADRLYYAGDGHFNPRGHMVAAQRIAGWLRNAGLVP